MKKKILVIFLTFLLLNNGYCQKRQTEVLWDKFGVPHIYAKSEEEMYYAFGWAQMHNHGNLILKLYGQARGKASEY